MSGASPGHGDALPALPEVIPIFPLTGALLLPGGTLPLNIFEPRYLALVEDALGAGRVFGMIQPDPTAPRVRTDDDMEPGLFRAGTLGRITSFSETDDGRYLITLSGIARFAVAGELSLRRGYRRIQADYAPFRDDMDDMDPELPGGREAMMTELQGFFARTGLDANWDVVRRMPDDLLVTTLCMVCPFAPAEKQALLEAPTATERAEALFALLRMGGRGGEDDGRYAS